MVQIWERKAKEILPCEIVIVSKTFVFLQVKEFKIDENSILLAFRVAILTTLPQSDCFFDLNQSVIRFQAQVYQHVGNEAVVTWRVNKDGNNIAPLDFYFDFIEQLQSRHLYYQYKIR